MKEGILAQKAAMKNIDVDNLADLRQQMEEMESKNKEINEVLTRDYTVDIDENELDEELKELDNEFFMEMKNDHDRSQQRGSTNKTDLSALASKAQHI